VFPTCVALVPFEPRGPVQFRELERVAASVHIQVVRDFAPLWGGSGAVAAFRRLEDVPPEFIPLAVINTDLPLQRDGFHFSLGGIPFGLVRYREDDWSLAASHEALEIICDQYGQRTVPGPSLDDRSPVDYLVEACDPCERSTYQINGVEVSDFVTPEYYDYSATDGALYSFLRRITKPLEVLGQGYVSWRTRLPGNQLYQAFGGPPARGAKLGKGGPRPYNPTKPAPQLDIKPVTGIPPDISPAAVESRKRRSGSTSKPPGGMSRAAAASATYGASLRRGINEFLHYVELRQNEPPLPTDRIIDIVRKVPAGTVNPVDAARTIQYLQEQEKLSGIFGPDLFDPAISLWLCMHIA
jgi:hypothetical protein